MQSMTKKSLEELLDKLASLVVDIEPSDLKEVAQIHEYFKQIKELPELPKNNISPVETAMSTAENLILDECSFEEGMETINKTIADFQNQLLGTSEISETDEHTTETEGGDEKPVKLIDDEILKQFLQNQESALDSFEEHILEIEKGNDDAEGEIKRYLHTLKGEAGMLDFQDLQKFIHNLETLISEIDTSDKQIFVDGLLAVKDFLKQYLGLLQSGDVPPVNQEDVKRIYSLFKEEQKVEQIVEPAQEPETEKEPAVEKEAPEEKPQAPPQIDFLGDTSMMLDFINESKEHLQNAEVMLMNLETNPEDDESLNAIFRAFHTIKGVSSFVSLHDITELSHIAETLLDKARKEEIQLTEVHMDIIFESVDMLKSLIDNVQSAIEGGEYSVPEGYDELIKKLENPEAQPERELPAMAVEKKVGEILVESGIVTPENVEEAVESQKRGVEKPVGEILVQEGKVTPKEVVKALRTQKIPKKDKVEIEQFVKVSTKRLDNLIDMVGELVIANSMVVQESEIKNSANHRLTRNVSLLGKNVRELQELSMSLRMVSVKATFQKMARLIRDLAKKNNKKINFEMSGEDTEIDRNVVEEIGDPLIHMVRNAADHGIETPEERLKSEKNEYGRVSLNAFHKGGNVVIEITDDGKGLDKERILEKAIKMGVIKEKDKDSLSDQEILNLIFSPGLSTAKKVTDVSGRGVGMDVVRRNIEALRGHVEIKSKLGEGSTISLMLPLTLAIIDGMVVRVGKENFIVPTVSMVESLRPNPEHITKVIGKGELIDLRGRLLPLHHIDRIFEVSNAVQNPCEGIVIVVTGTGDSEPRGFVVDELIGQQQVVIKSMGKGLGDIEGISGGAILGDGKVGLILDPSGMIKVAENTNGFN